MLNNGDGSDAYAMSAATFESLYAADDEDGWVTSTRGPVAPAPERVVGTLLYLSVRRKPSAQPFVPATKRLHSAASSE